MSLTASLLAVYDPGTGTAPPGVAAKFDEVISWVCWIAFSVCIVGLLVVGAKMAINHSRGQGGEHGAGLAYVLGAIIVIASASGLVGALT